MSKKAIFRVAKVEVSVGCPHCLRPIESPRGNQVWDITDVNIVGISCLVECKNCKERVPLPMRLFNLLAGV